MWTHTPVLTEERLCYDAQRRVQDAVNALPLNEDERLQTPFVLDCAMSVPDDTGKPQVTVTVWAPAHFDNAVWRIAMRALTEAQEWWGLYWLLDVECRVLTKGELS